MPASEVSQSRCIRSWSLRSGFFGDRARSFVKSFGELLPPESVRMGLS